MSFFPASWDHGECERCRKKKDHVIRRIDLRNPHQADSFLPFICDDCHETEKRDAK